MTYSPSPRSSAAKPAPRAGFAVQEFKRLPAEVSRIDSDGTFEGYASLFGVPDLARDVVERGAFRDSLNERGASGVKLLWQHEPGTPVGRWLSLAEDTLGLRVQGRLSLGVGRSRELQALLADGAIDGLSIGFRTRRFRTDPATGFRRLIQIDLWEVSLVTFPMLPGARVSAVTPAPRAFSALA